MVVMKLKKIISRMNFSESHIVSSTEQSEVHIEPLADPSIRLTATQDVYRLALFIFLLIIPWHSLAIFDYDRAIIESQKGNWPQATARLKKALADQPDRADILYDSGISAYKNAEFDKALAYFTKAGDTSVAPQELREQAYFNAGNSQVQLKQLQEAIDSYDKVLALNPNHEKAKHNKEVVKKMLEQEKKEQEQKDKEKEKKEEEENKENQQDSADDKSKADKQNDQNQKDSEQKQDQEKKDQQQKQKQDKENQQQQKENAQQQEQQKQEKQSAQSKAEKQESADAKAMADKQGAQKLSAALEHALKEREKKDAQLNKKMIKAMAAGSQTGSKNGNNCW
jgi:Ca-activated chloride channel family protein